MFVIIFMAGGEWVRNSEDLGKFPLLKGGLEILPSLWGRERGVKAGGGGVLRFQREAKALINKLEYP